MRLTRAAVAATSLGAAAALPRVLCCHGGGTNEAIMRVQTAKLRRTLKSEAEFVFCQTPNVFLGRAGGVALRVALERAWGSGVLQPGGGRMGSLRTSPRVA
ncbi:hypothetical protein EMIHUDRAFT_212927 [Emiliania huxleyi CCMP1516]|uniref:Serine hydrolase domain-containing protein n=2 Tax=Emiliania huxleyi TaxID=2903 RepID=A0A0D3IPI4_EMIH1|nr:hypothetical protein EMIHUDRAFT_212927 [Emiliania huxleyi CCMP1516]EOD13169.1 hypothetical protein EMIHUDRAFT_212927 [Emiliania huxleyi CCMP1516]|eukprot:XP_005765598.1 hypothetical protein EMIHUDRAFT_212927 [Emiliania huxleyi CCMP1516]